MSLTNDEVIDEVEKLAQYEIDHSFLIEQAVNNLDHPETKDKLSTYKASIEDNIKQFCECIEKLGGKAPAHSRDFKGFFLQGYAAMRGLASDYGVLQALDTNEKLIISAYEKSLKLIFPSDIKSLVENAYNQDKEILDYVKKQAERLQ